jgi:hypothetical protein
MERQGKMTLTAITASVNQNFKLGYATVMCDCKKHSDKKWVRVATQDYAKVAFLLQASPFTQKGAKAINCNILDRIK